jgi:hypothetical protein
LGQRLRGGRIHLGRLVDHREDPLGPGDRRLDRAVQRGQLVQRPAELA